MGIPEKLEQLLSERLKERFRPYEIRSSLNQIATRWKFVMEEKEKQKVARTLGGNRYAKTTYAMLDELFEEILNDR